MDSSHHGLTFQHTIASGGHTPGVSSLSHYQVVSPVSPVQVEFTPEQLALRADHNAGLTDAPMRSASPVGARTTSGKVVAKSGIKKVSRGRSPSCASRSNASSRHSPVRSSSCQSRRTASGSESRELKELQGTMSQMAEQGARIQHERDQLAQANSDLWQRGRELFQEKEGIEAQNAELTK